MDGRGVGALSASLPASAGDGWARAVEHPFIGAMAAGDLEPERFHEWIRQDRRFVQGLASFVRRLAGVAPAEDRPGLEAGLAALEPELALFESYGREEGIRLDVPPVEACTGYLSFLGDCLDRGYAQGLCAYYGCELAYLTAWSNVRARAGTSGPYGAWVENWTSAPFCAYVAWLGDRLDAVAVGLEDTTELEDVFRRTVALEVAFWDACWEV